MRPNGSSGGIGAAIVIAILLIVSLPIQVKATTYEIVEGNPVTKIDITLLSNTDRCVYDRKLGVDLCSAVYEFDPVKIGKGDFDDKKVSFLFKTDRNSYFSYDVSGLEYTLRTQNKDTKTLITITARKNPFQNVDHVFCFDGDCDYSKAWWNSSYGIKYPINATSYGAGAVTGLYLVNDTYTNLTVNQLIWCEYQVPTSKTTVGYLYVNSSSEYACVDSAETSRVPMEIDDGLAADYGSPENDLLLWLHLNGTDAKDSSIYSRSSYAVGAITSVNGKIGRGLQMDAGEEQDFGDVNELDGIEHLTMMGWFNASEVTQAGFIAKATDAGDINTMLAYANGVGLFFVVKVAGADCYAIGGGAGSMSAGKWYHVAGTYNGATVRVYKNGAEIGSTNCPGGGAISTTSLDLMIGGMNGTPNYYDLNGVADEVRIYNRTLTGDEIKGFYDNGLGNMSFMPLGGGYIYVDPGVIPSVSALSLPNITTFCLDSNYLYHKALTANGSGIYEYAEYCAYGCANATFSNWGRPGCKEGYYLDPLIGMVFVIILIIAVRWVIK